jgi:hypothetical protein
MVFQLALLMSQHIFVMVNVDHNIRIHLSMMLDTLPLRSLHQWILLFIEFDLSL